MGIEGIKVVEKSLEVEGVRYRGLLLEFPNACFLFLGEEPLALGTLVLAMPPSRTQIGPTSTAILGHKNVLMARMLAEHLAKLTGKISFLSLRIPGPEPEVGTKAMALLKEVLEERGGR